MEQWPTPKVGRRGGQELNKVRAGEERNFTSVSSPRKGGEHLEATISVVTEKKE